MPQPPVEVFTDGACRGNPGPGGWAWAVPDGSFASGAAAHTTNQRMEIQAALEALLALDGPVEVVSDSTYVVNCFRDRWWEKWLANNWRNSQRKPVMNKDLWEPLIGLYVAREPKPRFRWVKGHGGDLMNDLVDRLAVEASVTQEGRRGDQPPDPSSLGPADLPGAASAASVAGAIATSADGQADPRVPEGHKLVVFGHRPPELGGWDDNPVADDARRRLTEILAAKVELHPDLVVLTGLRLGAEQLGAAAAIAADVPFVAVLAHPDQERPWSAGTRQRFQELRDAATDVVLLERKVPENRQKAGAALARRDAWLARHADEAVLVWDRKDPMLSRLARSLDDHLGEDVWILEPRSA